MTALSILDLVRVTQETDARGALDNARDLAAHAEQWGFGRFWVAEHHNMAGIASAATSIVVSHIAAGTKTIRVGAGGIMLPNHAPIIIAEQFGTLARLYPGRIDLGLGRAPGTDQITVRALRRTLTSSDNFPQDVMELQAFFAPAGPNQNIQAVPAAGTDVPLWILGSSTYGAQLAAALGLPYAFASHFAPDALDAALAIYRRDFRPSAQLDRPYAMAGFNVFAADTDEEAELLASSQQQSFVALRTGNPRQLPPPVAGYRASLGSQGSGILDHVLQCSAVGSPETVARQTAAFLDRTGVDEVMVASAIYDHDARKRSLAITAEVLSGLAVPA